MLIVIDKRIPQEAKVNLSKYGKIVEFSTQGITYEAISGHPDIFICQSSNSIICAPNLPKVFIDLFKKENVKMKFGEFPVEYKFPKTAFYNCVITDNQIFHKKKHTDSIIIKTFSSHEFISLPQAYTRCSLMALPSGGFITSDKGIEKILRKRNFEVAYFSPEKILLPGMLHGFIGGALGVYSDKLFVIGNPEKHSWGSEFKAFLNQQNIELISLYDGQLFDGGGIFFVN